MEQRVYETYDIASQIANLLTEAGGGFTVSPVTKGWQVHPIQTVKAVQIDKDGMVQVEARLIKRTTKHFLIEKNGKEQWLHVSLVADVTIKNGVFRGLVVKKYGLALSN